MHQALRCTRTCCEAWAGLGAAARLAVAAHKADGAGRAARAELLTEVLALQAGALSVARARTCAGRVAGPRLCHVMLHPLVDHLQQEIVYLPLSVGIRARHTFHLCVLIK